jgi:hypothetical protein
VGEGSRSTGEEKGSITDKEGSKSIGGRRTTDEEERSRSTDVREPPTRRKGEEALTLPPPSPPMTSPHLPSRRRSIRL